jgi:hypothetical protein
MLQSRKMEIDQGAALRLLKERSIEHLYGIQRSYALYTNYC